MTNGSNPDPAFHDFFLRKGTKWHTTISFSQIKTFRDLKCHPAKWLLHITEIN